jgi:hypothetical protein
MTRSPAAKALARIAWLECEEAAHQGKEALAAHE